MGEQVLSITDERTGKSYKAPITDGTIRAMDLRQIKEDAEDFGIMTYDPAFRTAVSRHRAGMDRLEIDRVERVAAPDRG